MSSILTLFFYPLAAIYFVIITRKCFLTKLTIPKAIGLFFLSPSSAYVISFIMIVDFFTPLLEPDNGGKVIVIVKYIIINVFSQLLIPLFFMAIYIKIVNAYNSSIAMFVYLCAVMLIPNLINILLSFSQNIIPILGYIIVSLLFYIMVVKPLSEITNKKKVTDTRLFIVLPVVTFVYNCVMNSIMMYIIGFVSIDDDYKNAVDAVKNTIDSDDVYKGFNILLEKFIISQKNITDIILFSCVFALFILIIAFYVIVKNIIYMNDLIEKQNEVKILSVEVMEALAHTIDAKDEYTRGHSVRVAKYSRMIAERMGLSDEECENVYYMGLLHDIGKIGVPNEIINKPGKLTDEEYGVIKTHPMTGFDILAEIKSRPDLATGARWHHERYDGKGYPDNKRGEEIPIEARIIAVADSYDAMTSNRSYRNYLPQKVVREEILKNINTQFDEAPSRCMIAIIDDDKDYVLHE